MSSGNWGIKKGCIKKRSWNLKEAFSEECAICKAPGFLGPENSDINRVTS